MLGHFAWFAAGMWVGGFGGLLFGSLLNVAARQDPKPQMDKTLVVDPIQDAV